MEELKQCLLRIITAALICAVIQTFQQQRIAKALTNLVCGLILTVTVITPFRKFSIPVSFEPVVSMSTEASVSAVEGEEMSREALSYIIKTETEAYIQDKATELGAQIDVAVTLSSEEIPVPVSAVIRGTFTDQIRENVQEILFTDIGIAKENITWIG